MKISIIVAVDRNWAIGNRGDQLFYIREDLRHFKELTMGHPIIMGRKTFEALPRGPLPGRRNIVITRQADYHSEGVEVAASLEDAIALCDGVDEAFIIGGAQVYEQALPLATDIYLTQIDAAAPEADTFFPVLDVDSDAPWLETSPPIRFIHLQKKD
ncbi:MAG: dihydrofolate reductase [Muribaculaceae bacterium]|nr:dihydrofolate reductase [Muribaculaceae bacterium]